MEHAEQLSALRGSLSENINIQLSDQDCHRFLKARKYCVKHAVEMVENWAKWRNTVMPGAVKDATPATMLKLTLNCHVHLHPQKHLLPHALHGEDKEGRPLYYELSGRISTNYKHIKKHWTVDDLVQLHVRAMEMCVLRTEHASRRHNKPIYQWVVVNDLSHINLTPDFDLISYARRVVAIDQNYYPERLHKLFMVNTPWFFSAIFAMLSPFLDAETLAKFNIIHGNHLPRLLEVIDVTEIPEELGGQMKNTPWEGPFVELYGCAECQIAAKVAESEANEASLEKEDSSTK